MKKVICIIGGIVASLSLSAQEPVKFTVKGKIDHVEDAKIGISYKGVEKSVRDTTSLINGEFTIKGETDCPGFATIYLIKQAKGFGMQMMSWDPYGNVIGKDGISFYLDKGEISIKGETLAKAIVKGSKADVEFKALKAAQYPYHRAADSIGKLRSQANRDKNTGLATELSVQISKANEGAAAAAKEFNLKYPASWVSFSNVTGGSMIKDPVAKQKEYDMLASSLKKGAPAKKFEERLAMAKMLSVGKVAPSFTQNDTKGLPVTLTSLRGKYVLIDFWASWCGPCRKENPYVVKAYNQYKDKNFEILGVSLDHSKEPWLKAIADDQLPWMHVSDLKGWNNEVAESYAVRAVPQNYLLDPNGVIIAINLRGERLAAKLAEVLK